MTPRRWITYPLAIAAYPILLAYARNLGGVTPSELAAPLALKLAAASLLWLALAGVSRDPARGALLTALALAVFDTVAFASEWLRHWVHYVYSFWVLRDLRIWPPLAVCGELALAAVAAYYLAARVKAPGRFTPALNLFTAILCAQPLAQVARHTPLQIEGEVPPRPAVATAPTSAARPDIYYIILDGYARTDVLRELFGFDNAPLLARLEQRGFYVAREARSNFCQTPLSLSSSLNADYLNPYFPVDASEKAQLRKWIGDGAVVKTLRGLGYRYVTFATGFDETEQHKADAYLSPYRTSITGFQRLLISQTPLESILPGPTMPDSYTMTRERTNFLFDHLPDVAREPGPTFTFAHILAPHPPFVFGEGGEDVSPRHLRYYLNDGEVFRDYYGAAVDYARGYRAQAAYLTGRVEAMIGRILAESPEPPIIIVQSDHGSGLRLNMGLEERTDHHERMSILNAYYLPGPGRDLLYPGITPVNSFRVVFDAYFGSKLGLLPDRSYYSTWTLPFEFTDVTEPAKHPGPWPRVAAPATSPGETPRVPPRQGTSTAF